MGVNRPPLHKRITFAIMLPVVLAGLAVAFLGNYFLIQPMVDYLHQRSEARLRLASQLALSVCDDLLEDLVAQRLEDSAEMAAAQRREALAQLGELRHKFPALAVLVVDDHGKALFSTLPLPRGLDTSFFLEHGDQVRTAEVGGMELRYHGRHFPFWGWHVLVALPTADYLAPARRASLAVYLTVFGTLLLMAVSLVLSFHWLVNRPLRGIMNAAGQVAQGRFTPTEIKRQNELGQLGRAFNSMVASLEQNRRQLDLLLEKLEESEDAYRSLAERSLALITILQDGLLVYANPRAAQISGYTLDELVGRPLLDLVHPDDRALVARRAAMRRQGDWTGHHYEFRFIAKDGQVHWLEIMASPLVYRGRDSILGHAVDITERKLAQQEQEVLEGRLQQAQKMEVLGTLAGGVSHDFNNLLQVIEGYAQLLERRLLPGSPEAAHLQGITGAAGRGAQLIQQLLAFSRRAEARPRTVNVNQEVAEITQLLARTIPRMVRMETSLQADLPPVLVDPNQLEQVLINLAGNARDAMPEGGVLSFVTQGVTLDDRYCRGLRGLEPGHYVLLRVSDTGVGMDKETAARVFEPFFTTKPAGQGTGLGLATAYGIVRGHFGHITCYSEPGLGTTFNVYLPVASCQPQPETNFEQPSPPQPVGGSETILVVDDEPALLDIAQQMLSEYGYRVLCAGGGEEALEILADPAQPCHLVILDLNMPGMGGRACLREILARHPLTSVVISTGYAGGYQGELLAEGAKAFLAKPYSLQEMLLQVRQVLDAGAAPSPDAPGEGGPRPT